MTSIARTFGAPVTDPGGNVAADEVGVVLAARELTANIRDKVPETRMSLGAGQPRHDHRSRAAHPGQVAAHEVNDHHVLGAVLRRGCQRPALVLGHGRVVASAALVPLIGLVRTVIPVRRRNSSGEKLAIAWGIGNAQERRVRRAKPIGPGAENIKRVTRAGRLQPERYVRLEHVAGLDRVLQREQPPAGAGRARGSARSRPCGRAADRQPDARARSSPATDSSSSASLASAARSVSPSVQQRFECPVPGAGILHQDLVVAAEPPVRQSPWAAGRWR